MLIIITLEEWRQREEKFKHTWENKQTKTKWMGYYTAHSSNIKAEAVHMVRYRVGRRTSRPSLGTPSSQHFHVSRNLEVHRISVRILPQKLERWCDLVRAFIAVKRHHDHGNTYKGNI